MPTRASHTIACMKWGTKYPAVYANVLYAMLSRFLQAPFRLVCFTDDPIGLDPPIEHRPLPHVPIGEGWPERGWNKLGMFHPDLGLPAEPTLFLDLDVVITGRMEVFFEIPGDFLISNDWDWRKPGVGNSSIFRWIPGTQDHLWQRFRAEPDVVRKRYRNEQEYVSAEARAMDFWPDALCRSYKRHCLPRGIAKPFVAPKLPEEARVLIFHGDPKPEDAIAGRSGKWYRRFRPAPWLADYYRL